MLNTDTSMQNLFKKISSNKIKSEETTKFSAELEKVITAGGDINQKVVFNLNKKEETITLLEYCVMTLKSGFAKCLLEKGAMESYII